MWAGGGMEIHWVEWKKPQPTSVEVWIPYSFFRQALWKFRQALWKWFRQGKCGKTSLTTVKTNETLLFGNLGNFAEMMWSRVPSARPSVLSYRTVKVLMATVRHQTEQCNRHCISRLHFRICSTCQWFSRCLICCSRFQVLRVTWNFLQQIWLVSWGYQPMSTSRFSEFT